MTANPSEEEFRDLMAVFASGVTVVTSRAGEQDGGMTVSAFFSVTLDPPMVVVSLASSADTTPLVERSGAFAVNLLREEQRDLSIRFADRVPPSQKFEGLPLDRGMGGLPLLKGTLGALECRTEAKIPVGDHHLFVGRVTAVHGGPPGRPLLYWDRDYRGLRDLVGRRGAPRAPALRKGAP
jgi:flavin reductase (NADH)